MEPIITNVSFEESLSSLPQAANCIEYFRKRFFKLMSEDLTNRVWIAGGAIRDYFNDGSISKDVDFFCIDRHSMAELVLHLRKHYQFKPYIITKNAIKGHATLLGKSIPVDIVKKPFHNAMDCIDKFDFTVCCMAVSYNNFYYHRSSIFDLIRKRLVIHQLPYPVDTLKRLQKYIKKGFTACNGTLLSIAKAISEVDSSNTEIFEFYRFD